VAFESLLRPEYNQITDEISNLAVGPYGILQDINFWVSGVLLLGFSVGVRAGLASNGRAAWAGPGFVALAGIALFLVGFFAADLPGAPTTLHGTIHLVLSIVTFISLTAAVWTVRSAQMDDSRWSRFYNASLGFGIAAFLALLLLFGVSLPTEQGLVERILVGVLFLWVGVTGAELFVLDWTDPRDSRSQPATPQRSAP